MLRQPKLVDIDGGPSIFVLNFVALVIAGKAVHNHQYYDNDAKYC